MAKKEKEQKPFINLDGEEYVIEDMADEQKQMLNHINDIRQYLITILFLSKDFGMKNKGLQYISHFIYSKHNFVQILCPIIIENIFEY